MSQERLDHLAATFNCKAGSLPFTYLGLYLSINKPTIQDCITMVSRVEKRLSSTSLFLTQGGKLEMVNSVLSSMVTFYMCSIKVPIEILNQVDKYRYHCLWRGGDINAKKPPLTAWEMVAKPKLKGGLGVINLRRQNKALLLIFLHKFYNKEDLPWLRLLWSQYYSNGQVLGQVKRGSLWWRSNLKLLKVFKGIANAEVGPGDSILF
jgi:hypothetical protein